MLFDLVVTGCHGNGTVKRAWQQVMPWKTNAGIIKYQPEHLKLYLATKIIFVPHTEKHFVICKTYKGDLQIATRSPVKVKLRLENQS